ncbi:uncharacterized protein LOC119294852 [Triticum dicoccoides]|uniref:uncharacterized protein LOC119294852 n=1 Tax=Triticum dicoccoides TaxID=85692 RepID=UPI0018907F60|nr:uncharacterized protein LOC119294852 [Triticum dicoccoides]
MAAETAALLLPLHLRPRRRRLPLHQILGRGLDMRARGLPYAYLLLPRDKTQNRSKRRGAPARTPCSDGLGVLRASPWPSTTCSRVDGRCPPHLATSRVTGLALTESSQSTMGQIFVYTSCAYVKGSKLGFTG